MYKHLDAPYAGFHYNVQRKEMFTKHFLSYIIICKHLNQFTN
jgi:hypothetical protein